MKQSNCSCRVQVHRSTKTVRLIFTRDGEPKAHRYSFTAREALSLAEVLVDASELAAVLQIKKELN